MRLNVQPFAIAAATTATTFYILCSTWFAWSPETFLKHKAQLIYLIHLERYMADFQFSVSSFVYGTISTFICTYIAALVFVVIYNSLVFGKT